MSIHNRGGFRLNAGRKSNWSTSETQTIRVPVNLVNPLLEIARKLDSEEDIEFDTKSINSVLSTIKALVIDWRSKSHPTSTRWEKANLLIKELEKVLDVCVEETSRESIGRCDEMFGLFTYTPLRESELARRLGVPDSTLGNNRKVKPQNLAEWTKEKDPEKVSWEYNTATKKYHSIKC